jgi:hypothetical protein
MTRGDAAPVITFFNNKGGVGKTSLVYHLAAMMARHGLSVVAADFDPRRTSPPRSSPSLPWKSCGPVATASCPRASAGPSTAASIHSSGASVTYPSPSFSR